MQSSEIIIPVQRKRYDELTPTESMLVERAVEIARGAYAPYSGFLVGAAALLDNGEVVTGSNQENAAYPSGTCAERTALFYAGAHYPDVPVRALAIVALRDGQRVPGLSPCGSCRQVLAEVSSRQGTPFRVLMAGPDDVTILGDNRHLLPLTFDTDILHAK